MIQKTYILDTNVYGELLIEKNSQNIIKKIKEDKATYVYGIDIIEKKLEESPADVKYKGELLRKAVLSIAEDTYNAVNKANGLRTPRLVKYSDFKKRYTHEK